MPDDPNIPDRPKITQDTIDMLARSSQRPQPLPGVFRPWNPKGSRAKALLALRHFLRYLGYCCIVFGVLAIAIFGVAWHDINNIPGAHAHFVSFMHRWWGSFTYAVGSNPLGFTLLLLEPPVALLTSFMALLVFWGWQGMKEDKVKAIFAAFLLTLTVQAVLFGPTLIWHGIDTVYRDHQSLAEENTQLRNAPPKIQTVTVAPPRESPNSILLLKERAFWLSAQIRKLSGEQREAELRMLWNTGAAQGPTGILTVGTDQEKQNWINSQAKQRQETFQYYRQKYHDSYMTDAINIKESLLKHLPPGTRDDTLIYAYRDGFGYAEMDKVASDLERLAGMIPE